MMRFSNTKWATTQTDKMTYTSSDDLRWAQASALSEKSIRCPHEEITHRTPGEDWSGLADVQADLSLCWRTVRLLVLPGGG